MGLGRMHMYQIPLKIKKINLAHTTNIEGLIGFDLTMLSSRVEVSEYHGGLVMESVSNDNADASIFPGGRSDTESVMDITKSFTLVAELSLEEKIVNKSGSEIVVSVTPILKNGEKQWNQFKVVLPNNARMRKFITIPVKPSPDWQSVLLRVAFKGLSDSGKLFVKNIGILDGYFDLHPLINSTLGNLLEFSSDEIRVKESMVSQYPEKIQRILFDAGFVLTNKLDIVSSNQFVIDTMILHKEKKMGEVTKRIRNSSETEFPVFGIDREEFSREHITWLPARYELLKWLIANNKTIIQNSKISNMQLGEAELQKPIFIFWAQGIENAPEIVKTSVNRLKQQISKHTIHVLTQENYRYYVDLPEEVEKLLPNHVAHWTDILRVALLAKYGGIWIDATVFVGDNFEEKVDALLDNNHVLTPRYGNVLKSRGISNWFIGIGDNSGRQFVNMIYEALVLYIQTHDEFAYYYMFHALWNFMIQINSEMGKIWIDSRGFSATESHRIQASFFENKSNEWINQILKDTVLQKLTYKFGRNANEQWGINTVIARIGRR
ncbi:hypothetical protein D0499_08220 [Weissella soli]|nr:hypothetical protein [Weissella soli]